MDMPLKGHIQQILHNKIVVGTVQQAPCLESDIVDLWVFPPMKFNANCATLLLKCKPKIVALLSIRSDGCYLIM